MEAAKMMTIAVLFCAIVACTCMPSKRLFLDVDCDTPVVCPKKASPICCTDGNTYTSHCELAIENQRRICHEGQFNPIAKIYDGPCTSTTTMPLGFF